MIELSEVSERTGVSIRRLHAWQSKGLIPKAGVRGPTARYPEAVVGRVRTVATYREIGLSIPLIREVLK